MLKIVVLATLLSASSAGCPRGYNPLNLVTTQGSGRTRLNQYKVGIDASIQLLEAILCRKSSWGSSKHSVRFIAKQVNFGGSGISGGNAPVPDPRNYNPEESYDVTIASEIGVEEQGMVWTIMMHEIGHTMTIKHVGGGYMLSGQLKDYQFIDPPVRTAYALNGYKFVEEVDSRLAAGQKVWLDELLKRYTPYSYAGLRGLCARGCGKILKQGGPRPSPTPQPRPLPAPRRRRAPTPTPPSPSPSPVRTVKFCKDFKSYNGGSGSVAYPGEGKNYPHLSDSCWRINCETEVALKWTLFDTELGFDNVTLRTLNGRDTTSRPWGKWGRSGSKLPSPGTYKGDIMVRFASDTYEHAKGIAFSWKCGESKCTNKDETKTCDEWKAKGHCQGEYEDYMKLNCCGSCSANLLQEPSNTKFADKVVGLVSSHGNIDFN